LKSSLPLPLTVTVPAGKDLRSGHADANQCQSRMVLQLHEPLHGRSRRCHA
jgi:hypothetical protein